MPLPIILGAMHSNENLSQNPFVDRPSQNLQTILFTKKLLTIVTIPPIYLVHLSTRGLNSQQNEIGAVYLA